VITARAPSFLYHQVRLLVGTLKAVGCGDLTPSDVSDLLEKKDVKLTPTMAPACGLYLARVHYDGSRKWDAQRTADEAKEKETMSD
jgi:tRNA pseudouridine38-40 synthase